MLLQEQQHQPLPPAPCTRQGGLVHSWAGTLTFSVSAEGGPGPIICISSWSPGDVVRLLVLALGTRLESHCSITVQKVQDGVYLPFVGGGTPFFSGLGVLGVGGC